MAVAWRKRTWQTLAARLGHGPKETSSAADIQTEDTALAIEPLHSPEAHHSSLQDQITRLKKENAALENFVHIVAHDLKAPLRTIFDLADWVLQDPHTDLSKESLQYFQMMQHRTKRMDALLKDLLTFTATENIIEAPTEIILETVVEEIAFLIDPERCFDITVEANPPLIATFATPLRHILINLLSNAMKHHDQTFGCIRIVALMANGAYRICVADDGPGIQPEHQKLIFETSLQPAPKLHVETSGFGLIIVRKLLERYDCEITVESQPRVRRGSAFRFDFPVFGTGAGDEEQS